MTNLLIIVTSLFIIYLILLVEKKEREIKKCRTAFRKFAETQIEGSIFKMTIPEALYKQRLDKKKSNKRKLKPLKTKSTPSLARKKSVPKKSA